jgi:hypothetical protein
VAENYLAIFNRLDLDERLWGILRAVKEDPALEKRLEHVLDLRRKRPLAQDDAIKRGAWEEIGKAKKPERWPERNNEIGRLGIGGYAPGQILFKVRNHWPTVENGKPINVEAIKPVIKNRKK